MTEQKIREGTSTFDWWVKYDDSGEVVNIPKEGIGEYESSYVRSWNLITDRGWKKDGVWWVSPDGKYRYNNVYDAYRCQMHWEEIRKP